MATNSFCGRMATFVLPTAAVLLIAGFAEAAPRSTRNTRSGTASRRPQTVQPAPQTVRPAPSTSTAPTPTNSPTPTPPQPKRETEPGSKKPAIPHPDEATPIESKPAEKVVAPTPKPPTPAVAKPRTSTQFAPPPLPTAAADADGKYLLRYNFSEGEVVRWEVVHRAKFATTVQGATQTAETVTTSLKAWKVVGTQPGGETTFVHLVEAIDMRQKLTGRQETRYDSRTDKEVPPMFADAAKQVGVPLAEVTIDTRGRVLKRVDRIKRPDGMPASTITIVLPDKPLAVGESWTVPFDLSAAAGDKAPQILKARHKMTLESVDGNLAVLAHETQILSPIDDPAVEAQVVQSEQSGKVTFDLARGRIVSQTSSLDKEVFGFQGPDSKLHYTAEFTEKLTDGAATAERRPSGDDKTARGKTSAATK